MDCGQPSFVQSAADGPGRLRKRDFRSLLALSYLSHGEGRLRKAASFHAGC